MLWSVRPVPVLGTVVLDSAEVAGVAEVRQLRLECKTNHSARCLGRIAAVAMVAAAVGAVVVAAEADRWSH